MPSMRNLVVENIVNIFSTPNNPLIQPYVRVTREPLCEGDISKLRYGEAIMYVIEGEESKTKQFSATAASLEIIVEVYYKPTLAEKDKNFPRISYKMNEILAEVIKTVMENKQFNATALNTVEISNRIDIDGLYSETVNLEAIFLVTYRHGVKDPSVNMN